MLYTTIRIAARCASCLLIALVLSAVCSPASAQPVPDNTLATFAQAPAPIVRSYVPWASGDKADNGAKGFTIPALPLPKSTLIVVALATTVLLGVHIRPRKQKSIFGTEFTPRY